MAGSDLQEWAKKVFVTTPTWLAEDFSNLHVMAT